MATRSVVHFGAAAAEIAGGLLFRFAAHPPSVPWPTTATAVIFPDYGSANRILRGFLMAMGDFKCIVETY